MTRRVVIAGVGLMGGSLGQALRRRGGWRVVGWGRNAARLARARRRGAIDEGHTDPRRALAGADVVVLCAPVDQLVPLARRLRPWIPSRTLVMDIGSVKAPIVRGMASVFKGPDGPAFLGAHPMAGSEKTGVENARPDLYRGSVCAITPGPRVPRPTVAAARAFWESVGAAVLELDPTAHDNAVALVSHLPHLMADALMLAAGASGARRKILFQLAAGSFRDATRVAGADPRLWRGIFTLNDRALRRALASFTTALHALARTRWSSPLLQRARNLNDQFRKDQP